MRSSSESWSSRSRGSSHLNVGLRSLGFMGFLRVLAYSTRRWNRSARVQSRLSHSETAPMAKRITVEDLWKLERPAQPTLSPDGALACVSVSGYEMKENRGASSLWLLSAFGGEPRRLTTAGEK